MDYYDYGIYLFLAKFIFVTYFVYVSFYYYYYCYGFQDCFDIFIDSCLFENNLFYLNYIVIEQDTVLGLRVDEHYSFVHQSRIAPSNSLWTKQIDYSTLRQQPGIASGLCLFTLRFFVNQCWVQSYFYKIYPETTLEILFIIGVLSWSYFYCIFSIS